MTLKAYIAHPRESPHDLGCVLVYAPSRNDARWLACKYGPWLGTDAPYIEMRARRRPEMDGYAGQCGPVVETNADLPDGVTFFDEGEG